MNKRVVFWLCSDGDGGRYCREAHASLQSVIQNLPGVWTVLFLRGETELRGWDDIVPLPPPKDEAEFWYLSSTRWHVTAANWLAAHGFEEALYLDTDTHVAHRRADGIYDLLRQYEWAAAQSPQRDCCNSALDDPPPESFCTLENGVNVYRLSPRVLSFLGHWLQRFEANPLRYDNNDNGPLRDELWENPLGIRWCTLAPEFGLRFDFGCWVVGWVRFLHGRDGGISTDRVPLRRVADEVNSRGSMRQYLHGKLLTPAPEWEWDAAQHAAAEAAKAEAVTA